MNARKIVYIVNPISGTKGKAAIKDIIERKTRKAGINFEILPSVASGDYSFLEKIIVEKKITDVAIAGGDGTVSQVIGSLLKHNINFGIIPCGSGNGLAFAAGIPRSIEKAVDIILTGTPMRTDGFLVNNQFACMLSGLGFDASIAHAFANQPRRGLLTYIRLIIANFFSTPAYLFSINTGNKKIDVEAFFISIANSNQFGNNFKIAPKASLQDGLLDIIIFKKTIKSFFFTAMVKQLLAGVVTSIEQVQGSTSVVYFQTREISFINHNNALVHIDGEPMLDQHSLNIKVLQHCFNLIYPA